MYFSKVDSSSYIPQQIGLQLQDAKKEWELSTRRSNLSYAICSEQNKIRKYSDTSYYLCRDGNLVSGVLCAPDENPPWNNPKPSTLSQIRSRSRACNSWVFRKPRGNKDPYGGLGSGFRTRMRKEVPTIETRLCTACERV